MGRGKPEPGGSHRLDLWILLIHQRWASDTNLLQCPAPLGLPPVAAPAPQGIWWTDTPPKAVLQQEHHSQPAVTISSFLFISVDNCLWQSYHSKSPMVLLPPTPSSRNSLSPWPPRHLSPEQEKLQLGGPRTEPAFKIQQQQQHYLERVLSTSGPRWVCIMAASMRLRGQKGAGIKGSLCLMGALSTIYHQTSSVLIASLTEHTLGLVKQKKKKKKESLDHQPHLKEVYCWSVISGVFISEKRAVACLEEPVSTSAAVALFAYPHCEPPQELNCKQTSSYFQ